MADPKGKVQKDPKMGKEREREREEREKARMGTDPQKTQKPMSGTGPKR